MLGMNILKLLFLNVLEIPALDGSIRIQQIQNRMLQNLLFWIFLIKV